MPHTHNKLSINKSRIQLQYWCGYFVSRCSFFHCSYKIKTIRETFIFVVTTFYAVSVIGPSNDDNDTINIIVHNPYSIFQFQLIEVYRHNTNGTRINRKPISNRLRYNWNKHDSSLDGFSQLSMQSCTNQILKKKWKSKWWDFVDCFDIWFRRSFMTVVNYKICAIDVRFKCFVNRMKCGKIQGYPLSK